MKVFTNKIIIQTPSAIAAYWIKQKAIAPLFVPSNGNLVLRIPTEKYTPVTESGSIKQIKGIASTVVQKNSTFIGFRVQVNDSREDLRLCMREIAEYSIGNDECVATPITIVDHHYRRDRTDKTQGYRLRTGIFTNFEEQQGTLSEGSVYCDGTEETNGNYRTGGFSFKFMEIEPVGYF